MPLAKEGIALKTQLDTGNDTIQGDFNLLEQAFVNFFLNAIDAMEKGGQLTVTTNQIMRPHSAKHAWEQVFSGPHLAVSIQDTGEGIMQENINRVFDPFFTTKSSGTGMGLTVAHGIIQDHNGVVDAESQLGKGTTFRIAFPLVEEDTST